MLSAGTAKRDHQVLKAAALIGVHAGVHQRLGVGEKLMHAVLSIQVLHNRRVSTRKLLELFFASGVGQPATIKDKPAPVPGVVRWKAMVKGKTEDPDAEILRLRSEILQLLRIRNSPEGIHQRRQAHWQLDVMQQPAEVFQRVGNALQEVRFTFEEASEAVRTHRLHDADVDIGVVMLQECIPSDGGKTRKHTKIVIEQLLTQLGGQIRLGVIEKGSDVILEGASSSSLIVEKIGSSVAQHDVARLKVPIEEVVLIGAQKEFREDSEIVLERLLVERNAGKPQEVV